MSFYSTSVGKKVVMALSGIIVFGFVVVHAIGNLQIYLGPERLNGYAAFLHGLGPVLWAFRAVLLLATVIHIVSATQVTLQSWGARPVGYRLRRNRETTYAARTMRWGGPLIGAFVVYHILHLTTGSAHPGFDPSNVYNNVIHGFQVPWVSGMYIALMLAVGLHLYHGFFSMLQTLGAAHEKYNGLRRVLAVLLALLVTGVNVSIPASVLCGCLIPV
jgi:succinate dehydrogenase / fumarate reductase cytochrome b subunit